ncbi:TolB domain-containing protein [Bacillus sp. CECT 9360]|uniref:TolB family protein n=1 Tax=Bacillus sp. CECT 9360 TaxID=2845821 RepID=UPI001E5515AE|nr:TolB domain-containing protein [Bacillus sp. CECT 9360]CAH0347440.1 hypothetical protein BCI9360_03838 [Bacillus sp. CECT 9360]
MKKIITVILFAFFLQPLAAQADDVVQAAFIREGNLWTKVLSREQQITTQGKIEYPPQWSHDGKWVLYQNMVSDDHNELWVYNMESKKHKRIFAQGWNPKWSPTENIIAFNHGGGLSMSDLKGFRNVATGVDSYEWQPDGKGLIISSAANLRPDGWTNPVLFKIPVHQDLKMPVKEIFVIPKTLAKGDNEIISINAGDFAFSPDQKWISFIVSPTASWSMDSNMLCVLSSAGKDFTVLDEVITHVTPPKWAHTKNTLAYIAGGGRIVFGFKNKKLNTADFPAFTKAELTPAGFADFGFTWVDDQQFVVSRVKEAEWSNEPQERPSPSLYKVSLSGEAQKKITDPPKGFGDEKPVFTSQVLTWLRISNDFSKSDLWIADQEGNGAKAWIKNVSSYSLFHK